MDTKQNPKMEGSGIIDCIPQKGPCELACIECFYNGGRFYRKQEPLVPTLEEALGKIVRVNSGHDSNLQFDLVMATTKRYPDKFFNTSIPLLRFDAPTILTINGRDTDRTFFSPSQVKGDLKQLMFVRFRWNTWNTEMCDSAVKAWCVDEGIPLVLTDMRYYDGTLVKKPEDYIWKQHILNSYYCIKPEALDKIFAHYSDNKLVLWCGNKATKSTFCRDCGVCQKAYADTKLRLEKRA